MSKHNAENAFSLLASGAGLPLPEREFRFDATRRWRFDFAWPDAHVAVEIEGVTKWGGVRCLGRHQTPKGVAADCEKYNRAIDLKWRVYRYTQDMINQTAIGQVRRALNE